MVVIEPRRYAWAPTVGVNAACHRARIFRVSPRRHGVSSPQPSRPTLPPLPSIPWETASNPDGRNRGLCRAKRLLEKALVGKIVEGKDQTVVVRTFDFSERWGAPCARNEFRGTVAGRAIY